MKPQVDPMRHWLETPTTSHRPCDGLPAGRWLIGKGGVRKFVPDQSFEEIEDDNNRELLERLALNLAADMSLPEINKKAICEACGCLLTHVEETCPGCLAWAERAHVSLSWRMVETHYGTRTKVAA